MTNPGDCFENFGKNFTLRVLLLSVLPVRRRAEPTMSAIGFDGKAVPDIFEVESLCECYKVTYEAVLHVFGTRLEKSQDVPQVRKNSARR
jgi:hypothetical protein